MKRIDFLAFALVLGSILATQAEPIGRALAAPVTKQLEQISVQTPTFGKD